VPDAAFQDGLVVDLLGSLDDAVKGETVAGDVAENLGRVVGTGEGGTYPVERVPEKELMGVENVHVLTGKSGRKFLLDVDRLEPVIVVGVEDPIQGGGIEVLKLEVFALADPLPPVGRDEGKWAVADPEEVGSETGEDGGDFRGGAVRQDVDVHGFDPGEGPIAEEFPEKNFQEEGPILSSDDRAEAHFWIFHNERRIRAPEGVGPSIGSRKNYR